MPRSNRCIQPGYIYHLAHRCHDREFLLRCRLDRIEYCNRLREGTKKHSISLLNFCITCNHIHFLCICDRLNDLSRFMQQLQGEFAQYYNIRKGRSGAYWEDRFHSTMVDSGDYLLNCLRYIDLNMVRAGVVSHPSQWPWCGYRELTGGRERYRILKIDRLLELLGLSDRKSLAELHQKRIVEAIEAGRLTREGVWTESIAVGSEAFVETIASANKKRKKLKIAQMEDEAWFVKEDPSLYG